MTKRELLNIIDEEIQNVKLDRINEEITNDDEKKIREIIRQEVSAIFFDLFKFNAIGIPIFPKPIKPIFISIH